jgi:hypothetical protein
MLVNSRGVDDRRATKGKALDAATRAGFIFDAS